MPRTSPPLFASTAFGFRAAVCLLTVCALSVCLTASTALAIDYRVEPLDEAPPKDGVSPEIYAQLNTKGVKVIRGTKRTLCDIWLLKEVAVKTLKPAGDVNYPFAQGQLIGVARFARRSTDFRDQEVSKGVYTLRFALQPVDGNHVGTSPTRDFLLLLDSQKDKSPAILDYKKLTAASAEVIGSTHPALFSLQRVKKEAKAPTIHNDERHDWWIVRLDSQVKQGEKKQKVPMDLVVVGQAAE